MIRVIDNFVNETYYNAIEEYVLNPPFPWILYYLRKNDPNLTLEMTSRLFGFSHMLFDVGKPASQAYQFLFPMLSKASEEIDQKVLLRARGDMTVASRKQITYDPHIDMPQHGSHMNMVFYIGDSDGDTIIYEEKFLGGRNAEPVLPKSLHEKQRITPKANRLVIFSGEYWHTGQSPKKYGRRVILNINFSTSDYRIKEKTLDK